MIVNLPNPAQTNLSQRVAVFSRWVWIIVRVVGPNSVRIATTKQECENSIGGTLQDGIEINPSDASAPFCTWWIGELWAQAVGGPAAVVLVSPGRENAGGTF